MHTCFCHYPLHTCCAILKCFFTNDTYVILTEFWPNFKNPYLRKEWKWDYKNV